MKNIKFKGIKPILSFLLVFSMMLTLTSCLDDNEVLEDAGDASKIEEKVADVKEHEGPWTILIYLCGTDLESAQGSATLDMQEMISEKTGKKCKFIIQTGGCSKWQNEFVPSNKTGRYEICNKKIKEISQFEEKNMGESDTLADFVKWGVEKYGKGKLGLILWDHGGGSLSGVCQDENHQGDTLSLPEIDKALSVTDRKFEFVGYDACLMSTLENAAMLSKHALYMIASEETESGYGWDYSTIASKLGEKNDIETPQLGKAICDSFMRSCKQSGEENETTLAITNLAKVDKIVSEFDKVAGEMNKKLTDITALGSISKKIKKAESYGANTPSEGYTNMIDLGDMAKKIKKDAQTEKLLAAIEDAVVYNVKGKSRNHANGLSVYYPIAFQDAGDIDKFKSVSVSEKYQNFVFGIIYGSVTGSMEGYNSQESVPSEKPKEEELTSDEQVKIKLAEELHLNDEGYYTFTIAKESIPNVAMVNYNLYMDSGEKDILYYLGCDDNVKYDETTGQVEDAFEGLWPCLNGELYLTMYVVEQTDEHTIFSSPIYLNKKKTNLRFMYDVKEEKWTVLGVWDGLDESGQASRSIEKIKKGDVIVPEYVYINMSNEKTGNIKGDKLVVKDKLTISEEKLPNGKYYYNFGIDDIFGSTKYLDYVGFNVKKGKIEVVE